MAENKDEQLTDEELAQLQLAEENENAVDRLVKELGCPTRRIRQFAARVLHLLAERDPQRVVPCVPALVEALDRPEAQTRWEALDALTALATTCPEQLGDAFEAPRLHCSTRSPPRCAMPPSACCACGRHER